MPTNDTLSLSASFSDQLYYGQPVWLEATLTPVDGGSPSGTISYYDATTQTSLGSADLGDGASYDQALLILTTLGPGGHVIYAFFPGDDAYDANSACTSVVVNGNGNSTTTSTALSANVGSSAFGQPVTFTAVVTGSDGGIPTGSVSFITNSGASLGTASLDSSGTAQLTTYSLGVGSPTITARYSGDGTYTSSDSAPLTETVSRANTCMDLTSDVASSVFGQSVTLSATVISATATGSITFADNGATLGTVSLGNNSTAHLTTSALALGSHTITAHYSGDANNLGSSASPITRMVSQASTSIDLTADADSSTFGQSVTFTAVVSVQNPGSGTPTGAVAFADNGTVLGTVSLDSNGTASLTTSSLGAGSHSVVASYLGDTNDRLSSGSPLTLTISQVPTSTTLTATPTAAAFGADDTLTATVAVQASGVGTPTGLVTFLDDVGSSLGNAPLQSDGTATLIVSTLHSGAHTITATFAGNDNLSGSSNTTALTVAPDLPPPDDQFDFEGDSAALALSAGGGDPSPYVYSATGLPTGLSVDPQTGLIAGTIGYSAAGSWTVTVSVTDGSSSASRIFTWVVDETNRLVPPGDQFNYEGDTVSLPLQNLDTSGAALVYSAVGLPGGLSIDATTGIISGTVSDSAVGTYGITATITAPDGEADSQAFTWTIYQHQSSGSLQLTNPGDLHNTEGDVVSLPLSAGGGTGAYTYFADNLPGGLAIDPSSGLIAGTIDLSAAEVNGGVYQVTVSVNDNISTEQQTFTWTISDRTLTLANPGDQTNSEGDSVLLALQVTGGQDTDTPVTFAATGMPAGVAIDANTGVIAGNLDFAAAEVSGGVYRVTVSAMDGVATATQNFTWTVQNTNRLVSPGDQMNSPGDVVSLPIDTLTGNNVGIVFAAVGLPPGLSIDSQTGIISGTVQTPPTLPTNYVVTVTGAVGGETDSVSFTWTVQDAGLPRVSFNINDTVDTSDDWGVVNGDPMPVLVTLHYADAQPGTRYAVALYVPSGKSVFETPFVMLADGESAEVQLDPLQISDAADDVVLLAQVGGQNAGDAKMSNLAFKWQGQDWTKDSHPQVNAGDTPKGMPDRIPPRVFSTFQFEILGQFNPKEVVGLTIRGLSDANGYAQFEPGAGQSNVITYVYSTPGKKTVNMRGSVDAQSDVALQTKPGNAGNLYVAVNRSSEDVLRSAGFSVAAIPSRELVRFGDFLRNIQPQLGQPDFSQYLGIQVKFSFESDSKEGKDLLGHIQVTERTQGGEVSGWLEKLRLVDNPNYGALTADAIDKDKGFPDAHGFPAKIFISANSKREVSQITLFRDSITGSTDLAVPNSGYGIDYQVYQRPSDNKWVLLVKKAGRAVKVQTWESAAGLTDPGNSIEKIDVP